MKMHFTTSVHACLTSVNKPPNAFFSLFGKYGMLNYGNRVILVMNLIKLVLAYSTRISAQLTNFAMKCGLSEGIRILHACEVRIENSVLRVTVWHHEAVPSDAKQ